MGNDDTKNKVNIESNAEDYKSEQSSKPVSLDQVNSLISVAKGEVLRETEKLIDKQVQTDKASLITVFGVFASIISFLTIEFQFLRTLCSIQKITGFSLLLFSLLFGFNIALDYLVKSRLEKNTPKPSLLFSLVVVLIFILGLLFTYFGNEEQCKENVIYEKYKLEFQSQLDNVSSSFKNEINSLNTKIDLINQKESK